MQIKISTKRGERVIPLELSRLRIFKRMRELETRVEALEKWIDATKMRVAEAEPSSDGRVATFPRGKASGGEENDEVYTDSDVILEYLEGEEAAMEARKARRAASEEKRNERMKGGSRS